jgi:asparagine synthase (glutamine-hydrolysing)
MFFLLSLNSDSELKSNSTSDSIESDLSSNDFICNLTYGEVVFFSPESGVLPRVEGPNRLQQVRYSSTREEFEATLSSYREMRHSFLYTDCEKECVEVVRDTFGVHPIFYHYSPGELLAISDSLSELVQFLKINRRGVSVNRSKLAAYLESGIVNTPYSDNTFFEEIQSILPGNCVLFGRNSKKEETVLSFEVDQWKNSCSDIDDFGREFERLFRASVASSIQNKSRVGVTLSGGLDSSSVASMVRDCEKEVPIVSFFSSNHSKEEIGLDKDHDSYYSALVSNHLGADHQVIFRRSEALPDIELAIRLIYQPPLMMGSYTPFMDMLSRMQESGVDVVVTGNDGDTVVGYGRGYLKQLIKKEKWAELSTLISEHPRGRVDKDFPRKFSRRLLYTEMKSLLTARKFRRALSLLSKGSSELGVNAFEVFKLVFEGAKSKLFFFRPFRDPIVKHSGARNREDTTYTEPLTISGSAPVNQKYFFERILSNHNVRLVEELYAISRYYDIEFRFPFFSKDLYELCLAVPDRLNYFGGYGRGAMRQGLKGILIEEVRLRTNKSVGGGNEAMVVSVLDVVSQAEEYLRPENAIWQFVSREKFFFNISQIKKRRHPRPYLTARLFQINRIVYSAIWFDLSQPNP